MVQTSLRNNEKPAIAISCGDLNGVSAEIMLRSHSAVKALCRPIYCIAPTILAAAAKMAGRSVPDDMCFAAPDSPLPTIRPGIDQPDTGEYAYRSFLEALGLVEGARAAATVSLPISKKAWQLAGIPFKGHTDLLSSRYNRQAVMMLGAADFFVAVFTDHIPLTQVTQMIQHDRLAGFFSILAKVLDTNNVIVTGLNPHAGEGGLLGNEDRHIKSALEEVNRSLGKAFFVGPVPADTAFTSEMRGQSRYFAAMYHDQGLIPVKTLYFEQVVNVTLNLPVKRVSVAHGTAFDIAFKASPRLSDLSYREAVQAAVSWCDRERF